MVTATVPTSGPCIPAYIHMTQTLLFTLGTAPAGWLSLAQDLLRRAPPGVDLCVRSFSDWHRQAETAAAAAGLPLAAWAEALQEDNPARAELASVAADLRGSWGGLEPRACWTLPLLATLYPRATYLIFVEGPVQALAAELLASADCKADEVLDRWTASARSILRHVHAHPGRCVVLDAVEALRDRGLAAIVCRERTGIALREPDEAAPPLAGPDPLAMYLAGVMASRHLASAAVFAELQAACLPLGDDTAGRQKAPDLKAASAQLRLLIAARHNAERLGVERVAAEEALSKASAERDAARTDAAEVLQRQHAQQEQLAAAVLEQQAAAARQSALEGEIARLREDLGGATAAVAAGRLESDGLRTEVELARRALQTALETEDALRGKLLAAEVSRETALRHRDELQGQLESALKANVALEDQASALAERGQQLDVLQAEHTALTSAMQTLQQEHTQLRQALERATREADLTRTEAQQLHDQGSSTTEALEQARQQLKTLQKDRDQLQQSLQQRLQADHAQSARREEETRLLLGRLHDAHGESARLQQALRTLDERLPHAAAARGAGLDLGPVQMGALRDTPPHRELAFEFPHFRRPGQAPSTLAVRLVEHNGNPGLVVFADGPPPLMAWQESGREGDRPLCLFVPADADSRQRLARLSASDWLLLQAMMSALERSLRAAGDAAPSGWLLVLQRLRAAIDTLPARPRHDRIEFGVIAPAHGAGAAEGLHVLLHGVDCGGQRQPRWGLDWWPAAGGGDIEWRLGEHGCAEPALVSWPLQADGRPAERLRIAAGGEGARAERRRRWLTLPTQDLQLMRVVTATMPEWVEAAAGSGVVPAARAAAWHSAAQALTRRIDTDLQVPLSRRLVQALRGTRR